MGDFRIKDVSSLLSAFFDERRVKKGDLYSSFFSSWKSIAGERLAAHSRIIDIDMNLLIVEAEHPGWVQLLQLRQTEILRTVVERFPELGLRGIIIRLGSGSRDSLVSKDTSVSPVESGPGSSEDTSSDMQNELESVPLDSSEPLPALEAITDPELRSLLARLKDSMDGES